MSWLKRRPRRGVVLGCGPAGLFAAKALEECGYEVEIFSVKRRSEMFGAQYLHAPIPGYADEEPTDLRYVLRGTVDGYAEKVYGAGAPADVSPAMLDPDQQVWDIRRTYNLLWTEWVDRITDRKLDPATIAALSAGADATVSSIPLPTLCHDPGGHAFSAQKIWAIGDAPERGTFAPNFGIAPNSVVCDGTPDTGWYRASNVFGYRTVEWPHLRKPPIPDIAEVVKPLKTNCRCFPKVSRVGRYGTWTKGVLSHTAYSETLARHR